MPEIQDLVETYDRIVEQREAYERDLALDSDGSARRQRLQYIAEAALADDDPMEVADHLHINRPVLKLAAEGLGMALELCARAIGEELEPEPAAYAGLQYTLQPHMSGAEVAIDIERCFAGIEATRQANRERKEGARRYDEAKERFEELRFALLEEGIEPAQATERAKQAMGAQADDVFPPGTMGEVHFRGGRTLDRTTVEVGA